MADWLGRPNELVALLVALALGLGLISALVYARAMAADMSRRQARGLLGQLWAAAAIGVAVLVAARVGLGHALVGGSPATGWYAAPLDHAQAAVLAGAAAALLACVFWIVRTVTRTSVRPARPGRVTTSAPGDEAP